MIIDPPPKLDSEETNIPSVSFGISRGNQSNEVISRMILNILLNILGYIKTQLHPRFSTMTQWENISLYICLQFSEIVSHSIYFPVDFYICMFTFPIFQAVESNYITIINKDPLYVLKNNFQ